VHQVQAITDFDAVSVEVRRYRDGSVMGTEAMETVEESAGESDLFSAYLKNNTNGQTRIYFNAGSIPLAVSIGDIATIANAGTLDGTYAIVAVQQDVKLGSPYIVINKPYTATDATTSADVRLTSMGIPYSVVEATIDWSLYPAGEYYVTVTGTDGQLGTRVYTSEPVLLKDEHPHTVLIEYRNYDSAFDVSYTTGITHRVRVEGELRQRVTGGMDEVFREPQNKLTRLRGVVKRTVRMSLRMLPAYMHERLGVILRHDFIRVNGVEYQSEEGYGEPEYNASSAYASSSTVLEQVEWFKNHNDHDLGSINQQPLLIVNGGFLRL
jgi:hypothetical protein